MFEQRTVFTLVNKETCLLSFEPIDVEFESILQSHILVSIAIDESILLSEFRLIRQCGLALVIYILDAMLHYAHQLA